MGAMFIALIVMGIPALVILTPIWLRSLERRKVLDAITLAAEKGFTLPAEQVTGLLAGVRPARPLPPDHVRDTRRGVLLLAIAVAVVVIAVAVSSIVRMSNEPEAAGIVFAAVSSVAALPAMVGGAYLLLARLGRRAAGIADPV
jgi:hypothetical protein